jgi:hypothetical protein
VVNVLSDLVAAGVAIYADKEAVDATVAVYLDFRVPTAMHSHAH